MADLVQRLRDWGRIYPEDQDEPDHCLYLKAADRIEELEAEVKKAVEIALEECPFQYGTGSYNDWWHDRRTTLAELKGGSDEQTTDSHDY